MAADSGIVHKYGVKWQPVPGKNGKLVPMTNWQIEQYIAARKPGTYATDRIPGYLGRAEHVMRFITEVWGRRGESFYFEHNPNSIRIIQKFFEHDVLAIAGSASSGKTETMAVLGVTMFLLNPFNTKVLLTSITQKSARGKIFGSVAECWQSACKFFNGEEHMPGRLMSNGIIRYEYNGVVTEKAGLELVPGEQAAAKESAEKIQGYKRENLILMGDEYAVLAKSIHETAMTNLKANVGAKVIAGFNPASFFDPGGLISKPVGGWSSVSIDDDGWDTEVGGYCIHFDGEKSPNVMAGKRQWRGLLDSDMIAAMKKTYGESTKAYFQMVRGFWSPTGTLDCIYSEAEIITHRADAPVKAWLEPPTLIASLDPAFVHFGDRAVATIAKVGIAKSPDTGKDQIIFESIKSIILADDATNKRQSRIEQTASAFVELVREYNILTKNIAIDATGGGLPFAALLARDLGDGILHVGFKEQASDLPVSKTDKRMCRDRFMNLGSEIWYQGRDLIRSGQLKGLGPDVITEMTARTYDDVAGRIKIEPKEKMKQRTNGKSPDFADSMFIALFLARKKHGLLSNEMVAAPKPTKTGAQDIFAKVFDMEGYKPGRTHSAIPLPEDEFYASSGAGWGE